MTKDKSGEPDFRLNKRTCLLSSLSRLCRSWQLDGGLVVSFGRNLVVKFKSQASANELRNYKSELNRTDLLSVCAFQSCQLDRMSSQEDLPTLESSVDDIFSSTYLKPPSKLDLFSIGLTCFVDSRFGSFFITPFVDSSTSAQGQRALYLTRATDSLQVQV